jgi:2-oxoglutarate ferredoxin oxidoreductase subunit delta
MPVMGWIEVDESFCKGCELCIEVCPIQVLSLDLDHFTPTGYHPVHLHTDGCTGCGICAIICPEAALTIYQKRTPRLAKALPRKED